MRGGSQSGLVDTDGGCYVVKWLQNPQHRRILINEALCSELLKVLGVSSPSWARIHVDRTFLENNPQVRIQAGPGYAAVQPGWHFGSRFPVSPDHGLVFDALPSDAVGRVSNL